MGMIQVRYGNRYDTITIETPDIITGIKDATSPASGPSGPEKPIYQKRRHHALQDK